MEDLVQKYSIPQFLEFYAGYKFPDQKSKHTADVALSYYLYAYHQMMSLSDSYTEFFKKENPTNSEVMYYMRKSWSYAFAMYALLRTMLEALSILRKMLSDAKAVDAYYAENIKRVVDIANDIVKHPTFKHDRPSNACEPQALSLNGEIDIVIWSDAGDATKLELNPMQDFYLVRNYLEYIAERFLKPTKITQ